MQNDEIQKQRPVSNTGVNNSVRKVELSTYAEVRTNDSTPIFSVLNKALPALLGKAFSIEGQKVEEKPDYNDPDVIKKSVNYSARVLTKGAGLPVGTLIKVKIKDEAPLLSSEEREKMAYGELGTVVVSFKDLSYYHYNGGETLSASHVERLKLSPKQAGNM